MLTTKRDEEKGGEKEWLIERANSFQGIRKQQPGRSYGAVAIR